MGAGSLSVPQRGRWRWGLQVFVVLAAVWLALNGVAAWPVGLLAATLGALAGALLVPGEPYRWRPLRLLGFLAWFVGASVRGGLDVAWRAFQVRVALDPVFVDYRLSLPAGPPRTLMLSVISLLPGSLSVDLDREHNVVCVHLLAPGMESGLAPLEQRIARLFGLESAP